MTCRAARSLGEVAGKPAFRPVDGVSIRYVESDQRNADALLISPWPESVFAYEVGHFAACERPQLFVAELRAAFGTLLEAQ